MIFGMIYGGAVQHIGKGEDRTLCGRYVMIAGDSDAPLCKTCSRISGFARPLNVMDTEGNPYGFTAVPWTATQYAMAREALENATPDDLATRFYAFYAFQLASRKLKADAPVAAEVIIKGGKGDHSITSKGKPARKRNCGTSEKQETVIRRVIGEIRELNSEAADILETIYTDEWFASVEWNKISPAMEALFAAKNAEAKKSRENTPAVELLPGIYETPGGDIYKVQKSKTSGKLYASLLTELDEPIQQKRAVKTHDYVYQGQAPLVKLTPEMLLKLENAKRWGRKTGSCCCCGRLLTKKESIDAGIGPVCAGGL